MVREVVVVAVVVALLAHGFVAGVGGSVDGGVLTGQDDVTTGNDTETTTPNDTDDETATDTGTTTATTTSPPAGPSAPADEGSTSGAPPSDDTQPPAEGAQNGPSAPPAATESPPPTPTPTATPAGPRTDAQNFTLDDVDASLTVGRDDTVSGTITNDGPEDVEDAVLVFASNASDVTPRQSDVVLGDLDEDDSVDFEYPVTVRPGVAPGERQLSFAVQFRTDEGVRGQSDPLAAPATVGERDTDLAVTDVDASLEPGEEGTVTVTVENTGEDAEEAVLTLQSLSSGVLFGESPNTTTFVGEWPAGETRTVEVSALVGRTVSVGEYPIRASLAYTDDENEPAQAGPVTFGVSVTEATDEFEIVDGSADVPVGDEGTVSVTIRNTGEDASDATVSLSSLSPELVVGPTGNASGFVGDWPTGEERTVEFDVRASNESEQRSYPLRATVGYTDDDGDTVQAGPLTFGVEPVGEQAFSVSNVSSNLSVGEEGRVTATVTNDGPGDAENAVVTLGVSDEDVNPQSTEFAVGALAAGESVTVSFPVEVTTSAEPGLRQFTVGVEYDDASGNARVSDRLAAQVNVSPERDEFRIVRRTGALDVGGTETVTLELTNNRNGTVRNVNAKAFVDDPLSIDRDEAFVAELAPGESTNVTFEVSAAGDAPPGTYPLSVDFQYDTAAGDSKLSETYEVPIEVRESEGGGLFGSLWAVLVLLAVLLVGVGAVVAVRRRGDEGEGAE